MTDPELKAMEVLLDELSALDRLAIARILTWVAARYGVDLIARQTPIPAERKVSRRESRQHSEVDIEALLRSV